ncbi:MAG: hypothetical protein R3E08_05710 [Thiotrichaceae bacterium]
MGFTGEKAAQIEEVYITAFNRMELTTKQTLRNSDVAVFISNLYKWKFLEMSVNCTGKSMRNTSGFMNEW